MNSSRISQAAAQLAHMRRIYNRECARCGERFAGIVSRIYCSGACRAKAWRERRKGAAT
mgnify:CR=1 FL=1